MKLIRAVTTYRSYTNRVLNSEWGRVVGLGADEGYHNLQVRGLNSQWEMSDVCLMYGLAEVKKGLI